MKFKQAISMMSLLALGSVHAEKAEEPAYYEDYVKSILDQYEQPIAAAEEDEAAEDSTDGEGLEEAVEADLIADSSQEVQNALALASAAAPAAKVEVNMDKLSEAFGNFLGKNLKNSGVEFNIDALVTGIKKGMEDQPSPLSDAEYESMMVAIQQQAYEKLSNDNLKKADEFMLGNAKESGVVEVIPSKLQYTVLKEGTGETVKLENTPLINYAGKFIDGTVFSTSEETGGAITIPLTHTIPGFQKGITGMREGEKRRLFIHPEQGYGTNAGHLPPNSLLIFDIEVVQANHLDAEDQPEDQVDDIDDSDVEPSNADIDNSDVENEQPDKMMQK